MYPDVYTIILVPSGNKGIVYLEYKSNRQGEELDVGLIGFCNLYSKWTQERQNESKHDVNLVGLKKQMIYYINVMCDNSKV